MRQTVCLMLLLVSAVPALAQQPPEPDAAPAREQVAGEERDAGQQEDVEDAGDAGDSGESAGEPPEMPIEPADTFDPTEQVDEDISIPFPVDI